MKTSNKLLMSAFIIFVISLGIYNSALKAKLLAGNYKKLFQDYNDIAIKDFDEVEINGVNMMDVELKQGGFAVRKSKYCEDSVTFTKVGKRLIVTVTLQKEPGIDTQIVNGDTVRRYTSNVYRNNNISITCPRLSLIKTGNALLANGKKNSAVKSLPGVIGDAQRYIIVLSEFKLDSLSLIQNGANQIVLSNNQIGVLKLNNGWASGIIIDKSNSIESASLQINAGAKIQLNDIAFSKLSYHISDSANVSLSGVSIRALIKQ